MGDAKWAGTSGHQSWNDAGNWTGGAVPNGVATFGASSATVVQFAELSDATIDTITFDADAPSYTFLIEALAKTPALTISGAGVKTTSVCPQAFAITSLGTYNQPQLKFTGTASAGDSQISYYAGPPDLETSYGGGTIAFHDDATAGAAQFTVRTGKQRPPDRSSTLGGSITFRDRARAGIATLSTYGTLGTDGDTFANAVFQEHASADHAVLTNFGGTVPSGDGGNTEFYDHSSAGNGIFHNFGGSAEPVKGKGANGGDVALNGQATAGNGRFNNYPASVAGSSGGVTSFNNNPNYPHMDKPGSSAGNGTFINYGASAEFPGLGGHTELTARYGFATADHGTFYNFGSTLDHAAAAGHTSFSIGSPYASKGEPSDPANPFFPTAANATIWNLPGVAGGYTVFMVYDNVKQVNQPTAGDATIHNLGADRPGQQGGYTLFQDTTTAGNAHLIAQGGSGGGTGGQIIFRDNVTGGAAQISLSGNGTLDLSGMASGLTMAGLSAQGGIIAISLNATQIALTLTGDLTLSGDSLSFSLAMASGQTLDPHQPYPLLQAANMAQIDISRFVANPLNGAAAQFAVQGTTLYVTYPQP